MREITKFFFVTPAGLFSVLVNLGERKRNERIMPDVKWKEMCYAKKKKIEGWIYKRLEN